MLNIQRDTTRMSAIIFPQRKPKPGAAFNVKPNTAARHEARIAAVIHHRLGTKGKLPNDPAYKKQGPRKVRKARVADLVLEVLAKSPGLTVGEIAARVDARHDTTHTALNRLARKGVVYREYTKMKCNSPSGIKRMSIWYLGEGA